MAELRSLLDSPEWLAQASAGDILADALGSEDFLKVAGVASRRGNDLADPGTFIDDLNTMPHHGLVDKYGREVAENRSRFRDEAVRQQSLLNTDRDNVDIVGDTALDAAASLTSMVGNLGAGVAAVGGAAATAINPEFTGLSDFAVDLTKTSETFAGNIRDLQSDKLKDHNELSSIAGELIEDDNEVTMQQEIAGGMPEFEANLRRVGRDTLLKGELLYEDPIALTSTIAGALGSVPPSAAVARGGVALAAGVTARVTKNKIAKAAAVSVGSAIGIGLAESSGTFAETVSFVMGMTEADLSNSPEYLALRQQGQSHEDARQRLAVSTGEEAAARQLPVAAALGLIASKFNLNPLKVFKGKGIVEVATEVGKQFLEEGLQSGSSTLNRNLAIGSQVDEEFNLSQGVGSSLAEGGIAGFGMAGVLAAPSAARGTAAATLRGAVAGARATGRGIKSAATGTVTDVAGIGTEQAGREQLGRRLSGAGKTAANILDATSRGAKKVAEVASPVTDPVVAAAKVVGSKVKAVAAPYIDRATGELRDFADRPNKKLLAENVVSAAKAVELAEGNETIQRVADVITGLIETGAAKMTDEAILEASTAIIALRKEMPNLESNPELHREALEMLSSPEFSKIRKRFATIKAAAAEAAPDLNETQTAETAVTPESIAETLSVAEVNPAKVNPEHVSRILKQKDTPLTEEQVKILTVAAEVATAIGIHRNTVVQVSSDKSIALSKKPAYNGREAPEVTAIEETSESVQLKGFKDSRGKPLRSIADFAGDILAALQSPDGTVIDNNEDEGFTDTDTLVTSFGMLVQHLRNKVGALNESFADGGNPKQFRSIVGGNRMIDAGKAGGAPAVFYVSDSPNSIATAQGIHNDAVVAARVYNALVKAFPESFPDGELTIPDLVKAKSKEAPTPTPAVEAIEAVATQETGPEAKPEVPSTEVATVDIAEQPEIKVTETTPEEANIVKKLNEEMKLLKKQMRVLRDAKDDAADAGATDAELDPFFDNINVKQKEIDAKDAEIDAAFKARRAEKTLETAAVEEPVSPQATTGAEADTQTQKVEVDPLIFTGKSGLFEGFGATYKPPGGSASDGTNKQLMVRKDGSYFWGEWYQASPTTDEALRGVGAVAIGADKDGTPASFTTSKEARAAAASIAAPTTEEKEASDVSSSEETAEAQEVDPVTEKFDETFNDRGDEIGYESGADILNLLNVGTNTTQGYRDFAKKIFTTLIAGMNSRLTTVIWDKKDGRTVSEAIQAGKDLTHIRDFKNTMLVDPETGQYDPELLSIAMVAIIDWMSSVRSANPHSRQLQDTLRTLGVSLHDLTREDHYNILHGVSPRLVAETLAPRIIKMWNLKIDTASQMVDARGAVEGLVKEALIVVSDKFDLIERHDIPTKFTNKEGEVITTPTFNVRGLRQTQLDIGLEGKDSVQKLLSPEDSSGPSIGEKIPDTPKRNRRKTVELSKIERAAVKTQQDTPHRLAKGISGMFKHVGYEIWQKMQGWKDVSHLEENHPLRLSIEGKNFSIERDWEDAQSVVETLQGTEQDTPIYYRIEITKVGRHQQSGINPQNNKLLRVVTSPTSSTLDMTNQAHVDGFWLTVAQASGLVKVENFPHEKILSEIQGKFAEEFGDAVALVEEYLNTDKLDGDALFEATGEIEAEAMNAIFAVASLNVISKKTNALTEFHTTLGFELDGKTDGPAHMMANFGQGLLTPEDMTNFQRVGYFLGTKLQTLNNFFADGTLKDLYNTAATTGMNMLYSEMADVAAPETKQGLYASARFAGMFGDFKISEEDGLPEFTRDTLKNPMTKTVYGAGLAGVARGIAEEMVIEFYRQMTDMPKGADPAAYLGYPEFEADFALLFGEEYNRSTDWTKSFFDKNSMNTFTDIVSDGVGTMIATAAKEVIGPEITHVNDLLVFITNVQTEFQKALYDKRLLELAETRAREGTIKRNAQGKGIVRQLSVQDFRDLADGVGAYGPTYSNGAQTLAVGAMAPLPSNQELSSTMDNDLKMKSTMEVPDDARVKAIPYLTQGRGDAMVVNGIYSAKDPIQGTLAVHDGFYVPIDKIPEYAERVNEVVMKTWDRDVLGDVVADFEGFVKSIDASDVELVRKALETVNKYRYETTVENVKTINSLMNQLKEVHRQNQARKKVFRKIPMSVDHLAGGQTAATRGPDVEMDRHDINENIADELNQTRPTESESLGEEQEDLNQKGLNAHFRSIAAAAMRVSASEELLATIEKEAKARNEQVVIEDTPEGEPRVLITDTRTLLASLVEKGNRLTIRKTVQLLEQLLAGKNFKVVIAADMNDLKAAYDNAKGPGSFEAEGLGDANGWADIDNGVLYLLNQNHETLVHEMIHIATFQAVEAHYDGTKTNAAVPRLEALMEEFLKIDFSDKGKTLRRHANAAKAAIIGHQVSGVSPFQQAAALNEFMAWSLSSASLVKDLSARDTLVRMGKAVLILIKRMLGNKIPADMYSNILFNTVLLSEFWNQSEAEVQASIDAAPVVEEAVGETSDDLSALLDDGDSGDIGGGDGTGGNGVTPAANNWTNFWIERMRERLASINAGTDGNREAGLAQFKRYKEAAINAVTKLDFGGFALSQYQKLTFRAIHMVLATEMRLNAQSGVALNKVFEYIVDGLKPEMFGPGNIGQELYATVLDLLGDTKNDEGVSDALAVLLALSQTSDTFRAALDQLPEPEGDANKINAGSLNEMLTSVTGIMMNKAIGTVDTSGAPAKEMLDVLADNLLREDADKEFTLLRALMGSITAADNFLGGTMKTLADLSAEANLRMKDSERSQLTKIIVGTVAAAAAFASADRAAETAKAAKAFTHMGVNLDNFVFFREFVSEVVGTDKTNAEVVQLLDRTNYAVSAIRQDYREHLPVILQNAFETHPDAEQWTTLHRILAKLDFANLFDLGNPEIGFNLISDTGSLSRATAAEEANINAAFSKKTAAVILEKSKQLAGFMNLKGHGHLLWTNAYAINRLAGEYDANQTQTIDRLVSLYALEIADQSQKDAVIEMYDNDREAVMSLVTYIQALNIEEDLKVRSEQANLNAYKGYVPDHGKGNARVIIQRDDQADELLKKGWERVGDYTAENKFSTVKRGYYATTVKQGGSYSQGVMQSVQGTFRGVNSVTGLTVGNTVSGIVSEGSMKFATKSLNDGSGVVDDKEALLPRYDETGILYYERVINPDVLAQYIRPKSNLALMLGAWAGRQVEEKMAAQYNSELIIELKKIWDNRASNEDELFIDISDPKIKDPVYRDSYAVISPETKREIESVFGENGGFMIRKDMINTALGYRDPSIMDIWSGKTRMPKAVQEVIQGAVEAIPGTKAITVLSRTEEGVQGLVSNAKDLIVVRSLVVPYMNTQANVVQLMTRGVGTKEMLKGYQDKLVEIERFNVNIKRRMELRTKIALAGKDANKKAVLLQQDQVIVDENKRMSIAPLIEAGAYKNISEGITDLDVELTSGRMAEWIEGQVNRLPSKAKTIVKYGFLSKDTAIYKAANKAVQYGDFLAKSIMYDHLLAQGVDPDAAMKKINEEFINFSVLPGRSRQYLESLGATWFLSFKIRAMKVALNILRDNPMRALIVAGTVGEYGSPTNDNLLTVAAQDRLPYALGWSMLLASPGLNPYVNLLELDQF